MVPWRGREIENQFTDLSCHEYGWIGSKQVLCPMTDGFWALHTCVFGVFACHYVILSLTFCPNWNVLHPLSPVLMNACFSLGASPWGLNSMRSIRVVRH